MEERTFLEPAVAALLENDFIEARLHTDGTVNIERILELQKELTGVRSNPYYVLVDPASGEVLGRRGGAMSAEAFVEFLELAL
jgi:hypothetical protein